MPKPILPDTDVLIDFFRGVEIAVEFVNTHSTKFIMSSIVVAELYAGVRGEAELTILDKFVSLFRVVPITSEIARIGGLFRRDYGKSHGVGLADAILAATAVVENAELKTLNIKHYPMLKGLRPAYQK